MAKRASAGRFERNEKGAPFDVDPVPAYRTTAEQSGRQCRCRSSRTAGERLVLDAALERAHPDMPVTDPFDKIHIRPATGGERLAPPDSSAATANIHAADILDELDIMRRPGVKEAITVVPVYFRHIDHAERHFTPVALHLEHPRLMHAVDARKALGCTADAEMFGKQRDTPAAIPAHGGLPAIRIEIAHPELLLGIMPENHQPVGTDPAPTVYLSTPRDEPSGTSINHDKVVTRSFVFIKPLFHRITFAAQGRLRKYGNFSRNPFGFEKNNGYLRILSIIYRIDRQRASVQRDRQRDQSYPTPCIAWRNIRYPNDDRSKFLTV